MFIIRRKRVGLPLLGALVLALATIAVAVGADRRAPALTISEPAGARPSKHSTAGDGAGPEAARRFPAPPWSAYDIGVGENGGGRASPGRSLAGLAHLARLAHQG